MKVPRDGGMGCSFPLEPRQRGQELCVSEIKKAECERIKLNFGSASLACLLTMVLVLPRKSEDFLGCAGECSESSAWFSETVLTLSRGPGEFYLVWPRFQKLYDEVLVFPLISGYLQTLFKEGG